MADLDPHLRALLDKIAANPFMGQQELANALGVARSTIAAQIMQLVAGGHILGRGYVLPPPKRIVCIGGTTINTKCRLDQKAIFGTSNPSESFRNFGGVARNVAENLLRLGVKVGFVSVVGEDDAGSAILRQLRDLGADVSQVMVSPACSTAEYVAILDPANELVIGLVDMKALDALTPDVIERGWPHIASSTWVFADCNLPADSLALLIERRTSGHFQLAIDTVSVPKARRLPRDLSGIDVLFTNKSEANAVLGGVDAPLEYLAAAQQLRIRGVKSVVITDGPSGHAVVGEHGAFYTPGLPAHAVDVTGAGDSMIAGTLYRLLEGDALEDASKTGMLVATLTVESPFDVNPNLSRKLLSDQLAKLSQINTQRIALP